MSRRSSSDPAERVVRIFPDFADTPIWYHGGQPWEALGLSDVLRRDLDAYNRRYAEILSPQDVYAVRSSERKAYEAEGERLARELALDLGTPWTVVVLHPEGGSGARRFTSTQAPRNPATAAAFRALGQGATPAR